MRRLTIAVLAVSCASRPSGGDAAVPTTASSPRARAPSSPARSPGCGTTAIPGVRKESVSAMGKTRSYAIVVPAGYDPNVLYPVVFALHGNGGSGAGLKKQLDLEDQADGHAIVVYPDALGGGWDLDSPSGKNRDVLFFDAILLRLHGTMCVDQKRIFVTGFSNGAYMANQLACRRGERIRGVASHSGGGPYENDGSYDEQGHLLCPGKAVAALVIHGAADRSVLPSEGQKTVDHWSFANRCSGGTSPGGPTSCVSLNGCVQPVVVCRVPGLGHGLWREAPRLIWSFFASLP